MGKPQEDTRRAPSVESLGPRRRTVVRTPQRPNNRHPPPGYKIVGPNEAPKKGGADRQQRNSPPISPTVVLTPHQPRCPPPEHMLASTKHGRTKDRQDRQDSQGPRDRRPQGRKRPRQPSCPSPLQGLPGSIAASMDMDPVEAEHDVGSHASVVTEQHGAQDDGNHGSCTMAVLNVQADASMPELVSDIHAWKPALVGAVCHS